MINADSFDELAVASPEELWSWLEGHHSQSESVWCVTWKKSTPEKYVSRDDMLDALLAYGWIDGVRKKRDDGRTMQLISPRKQQAWAATYKRRAERLEAEGRMRAPGRAAIEASKAAGLWSQSDEIDQLVVPDDLAQALAQATGAVSVWDAFPPSYRRNVLRWVASAKRADTRAKRVADLVSRTARGERVPHY